MVRTEACSLKIFLLVLLLVPGLFNTSSLDVLEGSSESKRKIMVPQTRSGENEVAQP